MIYPLLPVYLSRVLGAGPASLGVIEGVAEGVNSVLKVLSGRASDRWARRKPIVLAGYALSSAVRPFIGATANWWQVLAIRALDRTGKGIRGAPRDAMLAQCATPATRGRIFGFHRAMDHAGAVIGPLCAAAFLFLFPGRYRTLFFLAAIPGGLAVWVLTRVPESGSEGTRANPQSPTPNPNEIPIPNPESLIPNPESRIPNPHTRLYQFLAILLLFSLGNSSDAFLLLRLSSVIGTDAYLPLLWAGLHVVKAALSTHAGGLSDRIGRKALIVSGWLVYAAIYVGFATVDSASALIVCFLAYGVYFGLVEGSEKALVADFALAGTHGTAFGWYNAAIGVGTLLASLMFGVLYERFGAPLAFGGGAALAAPAAALLLALPFDARRTSAYNG